MINELSKFCLGSQTNTFPKRRWDKILTQHLLDFFWFTQNAIHSNFKAISALPKYQN